VTRLLPAVLIIAAATTASAQGFPGGGGGMGGRGGMGGGRGGAPGGMGRAYAPPNPSAEDVEKQDPVKLLLDKKKKLKLDKTQIAQLATLGASLKQQNSAYYLRVDSLHKTFKVPSSGGFTRSSGSDGDRAGMMENRQLFIETLTQVRQNNKTARDSAIVLLKDPQKNKAYDMLEKQLEESDKLMRGPGGEGGMGGGRRRPSPD
jgi:hypothetical protein